MKDIYIDDGVPSQKKILFESGTNEKTLCIFLLAEKDQNKELVKEKEDIDTSIPDVSQGFDDDIGRPPDTIPNDVSKEIFCLERGF